MLDNHAAHRGLDAEERQLASAHSLHCRPEKSPVALARIGGLPGSAELLRARLPRGSSGVQVEPNSVSKNEHCCNTPTQVYTAAFWQRNQLDA